MHYGLSQAKSYSKDFAEDAEFKKEELD